MLAPILDIACHFEYLSAKSLYFRGQPCKPAKCRGIKVRLTPIKRLLIKISMFKRLIAIFVKYPQK